MVVSSAFLSVEVMIEAFDLPPNGIIKDMSPEDKRRWIKMINTRMMLAWDFRDFKALARHLSLNDKAPTNWIQKLTIPWPAIYTCHIQTGKTIEWILHGSNVTFTPDEGTKSALKQASKVLIKNCEEMQMVSFTGEDSEQFFINGLVNKFIATLGAKSI